MPNGINWFGIAIVMFGSLSWSVGTIYSRRVEKPSSLMVGIAMQMICGGAVLGLVSLVMGEHTQVSNLHISMQSILAVAYLIVFGSIIGYSSYLWLLDHVSASKVSTYAYVNPIVAIFPWLGVCRRNNQRANSGCRGNYSGFCLADYCRRKKKQEAALVPCRVVETVAGKQSAKGVCQTHEFSAAGSKRSA